MELGAGTGAVGLVAAALGTVPGTCKAQTVQYVDSLTVLSIPEAKHKQSYVYFVYLQGCGFGFAVDPLSIIVLDLDAGA